MLKEKINSALTKTVLVQKGKSKKLERIEVPPSERFVYGILSGILVSQKGDHIWILITALC